MKTRVLAVVALFVLLVAPIHAQQGPEHDPDGLPGYVDNVFKHSDFDSINLYNGQLTIPIPIGPSYPVGPKLKFQAMLVYTSKYRDYGHPQAQDPSFNYRPIAGNPALGLGWTFTLGAIKDCGAASGTQLCYIGPDAAEHLFFIVSGTTTWYKTRDATRLLLHAITGGYEMWDDDGNKHTFTWNVSGFDDVVSGPSANYVHDFGKGRNGWYLVSLEDPFGNSYSVEYYQNSANPPTDTNPCWAYPTNPCAATRMVCPTLSSLLSWIPKKIILPTGAIDISLNSSKMIDKFSFPVVGGTKKDWTFSYTTANHNFGCPQSSFEEMTLVGLSTLALPSDVAQSPSYSFTTQLDDLPLSAREGLLTQLKLPTGATVDYGYGTWYFWHGNWAALSNSCPPLVPGPTACIEQSDTPDCAGFIHEQPSASGCTPQNPIAAQFFDTQNGVVSRTETIPRDPGVTTENTTAATNYKQYAFPFGEQGSNSSNSVGPQTLTVVLFPKTDVAFNGSTPTSKQQAKGVLFRSAPSNINGPTYAGDRTGADIEERIYDSDPTDTNIGMPACSATQQRNYCSTKAVRVTRRAFDYDTPSGEIGNRRLSQETVCYGPASLAGVCTPTGKWHRVSFTLSTDCGAGGTACAWDADNGRHYNVETHDGTLGAASDGRAINTWWTPANWKSTFSISADAFPNLFKSRKETDTASNTTVERYFEFDSSNGFLRGVVNYDSVAGRALANCRFPTTTGGNVDRELTDVPTTNLTPPETYCSRKYPSGFPASLANDSIIFGKTYTYSQRQVLTAGWIKTSGTPPFYFKNYTRDPTTGWITASADTAGQSTSYAYDSIGRVTSVSPPGETTINVCYKDNNQGSTKFPTQTTVYRKTGAATCPIDYSASLLTWEHYDYDGLGRLIRTRRMLPATGGVQVAKRFSLFDGRGNQIFKSEAVPDTTAETGIVPTASTGTDTNCVFSAGAFGSKRPTAAPGTYSMCWDPFGRPQQIVGSMMSSLGEVIRDDNGVNYSNTVETFKTYCVNGTLAASGSCSNGPLGTKYASVSTKNQKDAFGQLVKVTEPASDGTATGSVTAYDYDVNGKLTKVTQAPDQTRTFAYDRLGFLRSELTPEKGSVSYDSIGSLGDVIQKTEGGVVVHTYAFDHAGRLTTETAGGVRYLMNCYDGSTVNSTCPDTTTPNFAGGNSPNGKLSRRVGRNSSYRPLWPTAPLVTMDVTEDLEYSGVGGRMSGRSTTLQGGANTSSKETWTYTSLGLVDVHGHPRLSVPHTGGDDSAYFKEAYGYVAGLPTSIGVTGQKSDTTTITGSNLSAEYALSSAVSKITAAQSGGSSFVTTIAADTTTYLARPVRISTSAGGFDTGSYSFDGSGNILQMNKDASNIDTFGYDYLSRVTLSTLQSASVSHSQNYDYEDRYGNLTKITTDGTVRSLATSTASNRVNGWNYDGVGNLTGNGTTETYTYDALSRQVESVKSSVDWQYLFSGGDERFVRVPAAANPNVARREMARFLVQAKAGTSGWDPATQCTESTRTFLDVHCADQDWGLIQTFVANGITAGCGGSNYCPDSAVTRAQMAVFLLKTEHGAAYGPPSCTTTHRFDDVVCPSQYSDWIGELYVEGITAGCGGNNYCPNSNTTEAQMAAFLSKGPNPYGPGMFPNYHAIPGGAWYTFRNDQDQVVTEFTDSSAGRDNVFLGNLLVASYVSNVNSGVVGWNFHAADHLGTLRLTVNGANLSTIESKKYFPFGEQWGTAGALTQKVGFAVMERDYENNRFYDHARNHDFNLGRFVGPDQLGAKPRDPQSWNRYAYARNNPIKFVDATGLNYTVVFNGADSGLTPAQQRAVAINHGITFNNAGVKNVTVILDGKTVYKTPFDKRADILGQNVSASITIKAKDSGLDKADPPKAGQTGLFSTKSTVSLGLAPTDPSERVIYASNVSAHEGGHGLVADNGSQALGEYDLHLKFAEPGTVMDLPKPGEVAGDIREFSDEDAARVRLFLNGFAKDEGCVSGPEATCQRP